MKPPLIPTDPGERAKKTFRPTFEGARLKKIEAIAKDFNQNSKDFFEKGDVLRALIDSAYTNIVQTDSVQNQD